MNGSELFVKTAMASGVSVCFTNPGTTELPVVAAFDTVPGIRSVLCLFEGACTGAADGYGRMTDRPAMTLLHLGPGLGNGLANLHNARRAGTPLLNVVGEHALWHRDSDPPLAMDIESLARTVSGWQGTFTSVDQISPVTVAALAAARQGMISSLIFPHDLQIEPVSADISVPAPPKDADVDEPVLLEAVRQLGKDRKVALILGGRALRKDSLLKAAAIQKATGCELLCETFPARIEKGLGLPAVKRIPYFHQAAVEELSQYQTIILVGAKKPVSFFGWPGSPGSYVNERQALICLTENPMDGETAMSYLAEALNVSRQAVKIVPGTSASGGTRITAGELTAQNACAVISMLQPEGAIVVEEGITAGMEYYTASQAARPHTVLGLTGGAIGIGIPLSVGAAMACPDRPVINLQADGSGMYTLQALWTQARESLNITTLVCSNRSYDILKLEMAMAGDASPGRQSAASTSLDNPPLDWVSLSKGMGVPALSVETTDQLEKALKRSLEEPGPRLIEMKLARLF
jgi:acetolactate synthase I/II/III large subunit